MRPENEILKNSGISCGILCGTRSERVKITKQLFPKEKVSIVCRILGASRSSYYRKEKTVKEEEIALEKAIISTFKRKVYFKRFKWYRLKTQRVCLPQTSQDYMPFLVFSKRRNSSILDF